MSAEPLNKTFSLDELRKILGFLDVKRLNPHLKDCFQPNYHISTVNRKSIFDIGAVATSDKSKINKDPVKLPSNFGDIMHVSISYRYNTSIGGSKYALFIIDQASRYK